MISITAIFKSKPEKIEQVKELILNLVTESRKEDVCARYELHVTENVFILWEEWKDQPGFDLHNKKSYLTDFLSQSDALLSDPIQVYKTTPFLI